MKTDEIREAYLQFFESKGCIRKPSDLLAPNDPSVLFTPAGMNQFKEQFLGRGNLEFTRATTCQKCIRTGDIDNVGRSGRHMTFFEMLGNFSFGDYFKREAIHWAWEFLTKTLGVDAARLSVTIYLDDDEAHDIWSREIKLPESRITRCGEEDNFWPASAPSQGPNGVCGPCSEIYVDLPNKTKLEVWNLVFTQFNRVGVRQLEPLPKKNIDTGMGLERMASVMQGVLTNFEIDIFQPIIAATSELIGVPYQVDSEHCHRLRRIAEHVRTVTFCMHEDILPSNEKQGYVVRRLLRRAVLDAYQLGKREPLLYQLPPAVIEAMKNPYPELKETLASVCARIKLEEERFLRTVDSGIAHLEGHLQRLGSGATLDGKLAFELHATHGFPIELTAELASQRQVAVDQEGFAEQMRQHAEASGSALFSGSVFTAGPVDQLKGKTPVTEFVGYRSRSSECRIVAIFKGEAIISAADAEDGPLTIILDRTPLYGESGGQVGDQGCIATADAEFRVEDTQKTDGYFRHLGRVQRGTLRVGDQATATVDAARRDGIERAHSATHLLHAALHRFLGEHAKQAGSKVESDALRFDFAHPRSVTPEELVAIEEWVNERIMEDSSIRWEIKPLEEARALGAMALFGEKYGDEVRVVSMGDFSREFCGGCHLTSTGRTGPFKIVREESVAAGTRRILAVTGHGALEHFKRTERLLAQSATALKVQPADLPKRIELLQQEIKKLQKQLKEAPAATAGDADSLLKTAIVVGTAKVVIAEMNGASLDQLKQQSDVLREKEPSMAVLLASREEGKVSLVAAASKEVIGMGLSAGDWIKEVAPLVGGQGGGRPHMAQAAGKNPEGLPKALEHALEFAKTKLKA